ncbi:MAG: cardiolipin synthase [Desulfopila sp.]
MQPTDQASSYSLFSILVVVADYLIRIGLSLRVIMRKRPYGVSLAWLIVILLIPFIGAFCYLLFGENRIPERRITRTRAAFDIYQRWLANLRERASAQWPGTSDQAQAIHRQAMQLIGLPAMKGNRLELLTNPQETLEAIRDSIKHATSTCHLQFYIWQEGGMVNEINTALIQAAARGVTCRLLLDSIGSRQFLKSETARRMRSGGIFIEEALPAGFIRLLFARIDIRYHRKLVLIDGTTAYTGSQNMVDPSCFRQEAGVGRWIDVMVRITGPALEVLGGSFISDWYLEANLTDYQKKEMLGDITAIRELGDVNPVAPRGTTAVQLVPSGPMFIPEAIHSLLLTTIYTSRSELVMTTPYFIPDEPILVALQAAAQRGVDVRIIVPARNDSTLVYFASRARYAELCRAGVRIFLFSSGLLHSKTVTVDGQIALFGSVNLDMRSFWLNFEMSLFIYCQDFTRTLRQTQQSYLDQSAELDFDAFQQRRFIEKFKENTCLLISPLL